ncbi:MAG: phage tail protein [Sediminibacterium sp.]|nr:phage tail protein [Sediminibacterium sp.]
MSEYYPPVGFYFSLSVSGMTGNLDVAFQEVSGINAEMNVEEIGAGGENRFKYKVPTGARYGNLIAKRGLVTSTSQLAKWCTDTIGSDLTNPISPKSITVTLMGPDAQPLKAWNFVNAWPVKWSVSDFKSTEGEIVVESIEFAYTYFNSA